MPIELEVLCFEEPHSEDLNIVKLAEFLGLRCNVICLHNNKDTLNTIAEYFKGTDHCIAIRCETLSLVFQQTKDVNELRNLLFKTTSFLFIHGFLPGKSANNVLPLITNNTVKSASGFNSNKYEYSISQNFKEITGELSGLTINPINDAIDFKFNLVNKDTENNINKIITIDKESFFISLQDQNCEIFLVANCKIINIDSYIEKTDNLKKYFSEFIPLMMFLKHVFKKACWHNDNLYANLIIDDPLLKKNYGFLNYKKLLNSMYEFNFSTTIAFIPWNYKRTDKRVGELFRKQKGKLNLCVHGYDHTQAEFATSDKNELNAMIRLSTERMDTHTKLTGVDYAKVIVFPQGYFSQQAMRILKTNNYLAAVNSTAYSVDSDRIKMSDHLDIAIMCHENFPLFTRRYPSDKIVDFAIDAFLGKPLFIVEHHGYFKDGYVKNENFIQKINSISKKIQWKGLDTILKNSYLKRIGNSGEVFCKIYTNKVIITNTFDVNKKFNIQKKETANIPIQRVLIDGKQIKYSINNKLLTITFEMKLNEIVKLDILYENINGGEKYKRNSLGDRIRVLSRRYLSEIRDNYISKNKFLLFFVYKLKRKFLK